MTKAGTYILVMASLLMPALSAAEVVHQQPQNLSCTVSGTGSGLCDIIFAPGTISSCSNGSRFVFDPNSGTLGKQIYAMVLAALAAEKTLQISVAGCDSNGKALIDWIII